MSIRLRLTLLYSAILAITLIAFSTLLYVAQAQATYDIIKTNLETQTDAFANAPRHPSDRPDSRLPQGPLPGRLTQVLNPDGTVSARTGDLADASLPLSVTGLQSIQNGAAWFETAQLDNEPFLIYSRPLTTSNTVTGIVQVAAPLAEREQTLNTLRLALIIGSGLAILAAFAIGWILAGAALDPIHRITRTAQAIGAERNFGHRVEHIGPTDEIGQLALTFNTMLTELESAYRQIEQALESQRRFVADASHELRTPLTTIRGNIELLGHEPPIEAKDRTEVLSDAKDEVDRMIRLVNQLLLLARVDAGRRLHREAIPLKPLLEDVCRQMRLNAPQRTILSESLLEVSAFGDRDALKQIFVILLDNALVHTQANATIRVTDEKSNGRVTVRVSDNGPGITPKLLPHIFERFYRAEASRTGTSMGLGLAIAKELVEAQAGTIAVESQVGEGTVFTVTLQTA